MPLHLRMNLHPPPLPLPYIISPHSPNPPTNHGDCDTTATSHRAGRNPPPPGQGGERSIASFGCWLPCPDSCNGSLAAQSGDM